MSGSPAGRNGHGLDGHGPLLLSMERELQRWRNRSQADAATASIHRVPPSMRVDLCSIEPKVVSIGPYHHGKASLQPMEQHKWGSLAAILELNRNRRLEDYLHEMTALEAPARSCYSEDAAGMGSQEFATMLLLDGSFLAVLFLGEGVGTRPRWFAPAVLRDVLLLENLIPFFVVQRITDMAVSSSTGETNQLEASSLPKRVAETLRDVLGLHANTPMDSAGLQHHHHLLHLLHSVFFRPVRETGLTETWRTKKALADPRLGAATRTMLSLVPSATDLADAGVKLKKREECGLLDATFLDSTMQVPFLRVDHLTASLLQNLVAWENSHPDAGHQVTAYVLFMDRLVRTARDVAVLSEKGIMENRLGSDGEVAHLFDGLASGIAVDLDGGCYLKPTLQRLRKYQKSNLHKWKAWVKREFSGNDEFYLSLLLE